MVGERKRTTKLIKQWWFKKSVMSVYLAFIYFTTKISKEKKL